MEIVGDEQTVCVTRESGKGKYVVLLWKLMKGVDKKILGEKICMM